MNTLQRFHVASPGPTTLGTSNRFIGMLLFAFLLALIAQPCNSIYGQEPYPNVPLEQPRPFRMGIDQHPPLENDASRFAELERQIAELQMHISQFSEMAEQTIRERVLFEHDPLRDGLLEVLDLSNNRSADAERLAQILQDLIGPHNIRVAPDEEHSRLFLYGGPQVLNRVAKVMENLDRPGTSQPAAAARPLMVRIFWVADGLAENESEHLMDYLPESLHSALGRLGLKDPRIVSQSVSSLALDGDQREAGFEFRELQAIVHGKRLFLSSQGELSLRGDDRVRLEMEVEVHDQEEASGLHGSLTAPLGHYMVLGTASTLVGEETPAPTRFAFVVQVIEAQSYQPE